jgi:hypothetical protein
MTRSQRFLIGPTTALLGLLAITADTTPALAGADAGSSSLGTVEYAQLSPQLSSRPQAARISIFGGHETFAQTPCAGDFGMLGNIEAAQVAPANPMNAPVCD